MSQRMISRSELSDRLRALERWGVEVPVLNFSNIMPTYVETTGDGVEIYNPGSIRVPPGHVIDSHGNVVNIRKLESKAAYKMVNRNAAK